MKTPYLVQEPQQTRSQQTMRQILDATCAFLGIGSLIKHRGGRRLEHL